VLLSPAVQRAQHTTMAFHRTMALLVTFHIVNSIDYAPFVTFNDGLVTVDKMCTDAEMTLISETVKTAAVSGSRRRLGSGKKHRELQLLKCMPLMAWATNKCGGTKYTRRLDAKEFSSAASGSHSKASNANDVRELQSSICDANITRFNSKLDSVTNIVSSKCQAFVATRSFECRQLLDCDITTFHTWFANNDTVFKSNFPAVGGNSTLCSKTNWAFQADTNFDVGNVQFTLTGPNGYSFSRIGRGAPYYIFGNNRTDLFGNRHFFNGTLLQVGTYTLTAAAIAAPQSPHVAQFNIVFCK
jgi:hypothetical protein